MESETLTPAELARCVVRLEDVPRFPLQGAFLRSEAGEHIGLQDAGDDVLAANISDLDGVPTWMRRGELWVTTASAATRDRLARWVAAQVELPQPTNGTITTAPCFEWTEFGEVWIMTAYRGTPRIFSEPDFDIDPHDPRLLPDGSRWVDAVALAEVARHLGGIRG